MTELQKLQAQKKEIERKIQELKGKAVVAHGAKLYKEYWACKPDSWNIAIQTHLDEIYCSKKPPRWFSIVKCTERVNTVNIIDIIIHDLQELKEKIEEVEE